MSSAAILPAILVTDSSSKQGPKQPKGSPGTDPMPSNNPPPRRLPTQQLLDVARTRQTLAAPIFTLQRSDRVSKSFPKPSDQLQDTCANAENGEPQKRKPPKVRPNDGDSPFPDVGVCCSCAAEPSPRIKSGNYFNQAHFSTPFSDNLRKEIPGSFKHSKRSTSRPSSVTSSASPITPFGRKETPVISDNYWQQRLSVRTDAALSASMRVHTGSLDDVTTLSDLKSPEEGLPRVRPAASPNSLRSPSEVTDPVHVVKCDCGRVMDVKCMNLTREAESVVTLTADLSPLLPLEVTLNPVKGHKLKLITEVLEAMNAQPDDAAVQKRCCKDLGYYADESTFEVIAARKDAVRCLIEVITKNLTKKDVLQEAALSLLKFAHASESACRNILESDGIDALFKLIRLRPNDLHLSSVACRVLIAVSCGCDDYDDDLCVCQTSIEDLLYLLVMYPNDVDIHSYVSDLLAVFFDRDEMEETWHVVIEELLKGIARFGSNATVVGKICLALGTIANGRCKFGPHVEDGAVEKVLGAMMALAEDLNTQESGMWALSSMTQDCPICCKRLHEVSGLKHVFKTMGYYPEDEELQKYCAWVIGNAFKYTPDAIMPHMTDCRVVELLTCAMTNHPENVEMFTQIAFIMEQAAANSDEAKELFFEMKGVEYLVDGMAMFPDCRDFQENAVSALGNFALDASQRSLLPEEGAVTAIVDTMLNLELSEAIQQYGCSALANIAHMVTNNKVFIVNNNGVHALVNCMRHFKDRRDIMVAALGAMANISGHDVTNLRLVEGNIIPHVIATLAKYPDDGTIWHLGCSLLADLVCVSGILEETLLSVAKSVISHHEDDIENEQQALATAVFLDNLKYSGTTGMKVFKRVYGLDVVIKLMQRHRNHEEILKSGCKLLALLVLDGHPGTSSMNDIICHVIKNFKRNETLELLACGTLSYLTGETSDIPGLELIPHLRSILDLYPQNERIQVIVMLCIRNSLMKGLLADVIAPSMVMQIIRSMKAFPDNSEIQVSGCEILDFMTKCEVAKGELKNRNVGVLIEDIMKRFTKLEQIQESGSHMIMALKDEFNIRL